VPFALERWFAAQPRDWRCDLSPSGARALSLDELLALASPSERAEFARAPLGYGPGQGSTELRALIATRYPGVDDEDVVVTCGAIEALLLCVGALVGPGDEIIVQQPMYGAVAGMAQALGARVRPWILEEERGYRADLSALAALLSPRTRLVAITQPNNPTGAVLEDDAMGELVHLIGSVGAWLLSDEVSRDLALGPQVVTPAVATGYDRAISVADVTKPFGLGGLRVGWFVSRAGELRAAASARRDYTTLSPATPSDLLARIALRHAAEIIAQPAALAREHLRELNALAAAHDMISLVPPRAGLTAFVRARGASALQRHLADEGVLVVPGELFGAPDHLRIWLGASDDSFAYALSCIDRYLASD